MTADSADQTEPQRGLSAREAYIQTYVTNKTMAPGSGTTVVLAARGGG